MKSIKILIVIIVLLAGCKKDEIEPTPSEVFLDRLEGTWTLTTVTLDDVDGTKYFRGLEISFDANRSFTVKNAITPVWPSGGSFELQPRQEQFDIVRMDGILISVLELADQSVRLSFTYNPANGRTQGIGGEYEFVMRRE